MQRRFSSPLGFAAIAVLCTLCGCPSAYQRTYDQQMQNLEQQQRAQTAAEVAAHAEAQKYAAVIYFQTGSSIIDADGQRELRWFVQQMQPYPQATFLIQGFADATGGDATNQGLSQSRADAVAAYLSSQGINAPRMLVQGLGTESPAATNVTSKGRRDNRRVEVTVR